MGKRFLVSALLVVVIVGGIAAGAALFFSNQYKTLEATEPSPSASEALAALPVQSEQASAAEETLASAGDAAVPSPEASAVSTDDTTARAKALLQDMTLDQKICQMLFVTPEALTGYTKVTQSGSVTEDALAQYPVGGIIYFSDNLVSVSQTQDMITNIQTYAKDQTGIGLFIGVDEEGGTVARVGDNLGTTTFDDMSTYGAAGDTQKAYEIGTTLASDLKNLGFNVDFAPVADVLTNDENTVDKYRSFGSDPNLVASMVSEEVKGLTEGGILCAPKHFPGHGSTAGDTHDGTATSDRTKEELEACDLIPFQAAIDAGAPMVMVGHMTMTAIDSENPASFSNTIVTGMLRQELGYNGIIITDALNMDAISDNYTSGEAAVKAISAGCDMLLCISNISSAVEAVKAAVDDGTISESAIDDSVTRILSAKLQYGIAS